MSRSIAERPTLNPSAIGNFFRLQSCPMYLQWEYDQEAEEAIQGRSWETSDVSPVLTSEGDSFERRQLQTLDTEATFLYGVVEEDETGIDFVDTWADDPEIGGERVLDIAAETAARGFGTEMTVISQPHISGTIGAYPIAGKGDILLLEPTETGVRPMLLEVKSSSKQKVYHRYQATIYSVLVAQLLETADVPLDIADDYIETKVITPDNSLDRGVDKAHSFDIAPYHAKLELKLAEGGSFDQTILDTSFESTTNRIAKRCSGCEYEPMCMTRGLENQGLELLGLQAGTQEMLHGLGIDTVSDFATLYDEDFESSVHWDNSTPTPADYAQAHRVRQDAEVTNLQKRVQIAYRFVSEFDERYGNNPDFYATPLRGTGNNIPEDEHGTYDVDWTVWGGADYPSGSLIRVYPYVQVDHAQDRITLLGARIACAHTEYDSTIVVPPASIPTTEAEREAEENRLFREFFTRLADAVKAANPDYWTDPAFSDVDVPDGHGFLHLYFYSTDQRDALIDTIDEHRGASWGRPLRTLLGLRAGIDQEMVSVIQDDFRQRWALRFPGLGTVQSTAQFHHDGDWFDWRPTVDGSDLPVDSIFRTGLFDGAVRYRSKHGGTLRGEIELDHENTRTLWTPADPRLAQWYYPVTNREADQIPVEYIWGVHDRLTEKAASDPEQVRPYLYRTSKEEKRITESDVSALAGQFARATEHVERTIQSNGRYATDQFVDKEPIRLEELENFTFDARTLHEVCIEYQQLEYRTDKEELEAYYRQPLEERVDTGASFVFECAAIDEENDQLRGRLVIPTESGFEPATDRESIASLSVSEGDFMVLTRLDPTTDERPELTRRERIENIANSCTVPVRSIDDDGTIILSAPFTDGWPWWGQYTVRHRGWSTSESARDNEWQTYVAEGELYVVDPMQDKITQNRAYEALEHAVDTPIHRWTVQIYDGRRQRVKIDRWDGDHVTDYLNWMEDADDFARPRNGQDDFVEDISHGIITLQGPPGTGKTRYTIAPSVLGRVHSDLLNGRDHLAVVSAVSHTAVNEALEATLELNEVCPPGSDRDAVDFVRICSSAGQGIDHERIQNVNYNQADDEELVALFERYFGPDASEDQQAIFFGPPVSIRSCLNRMLRLWSDGDDAIRIRDWMESGDSAVFDLAVIDEASMMDLPLFFLLGAFVAEGGQLMLVGDHRQMQPIQKHDWESEDREPIEHHRPFLSTLDFFRFLRGETDVDLEFINRNPPELDDPDETLPNHRLFVTYRLPQESADMHTDLFYQQDGIELESGSTGVDMPPITGPSADLLNSEDRITLLVHDESGSQKSNPVEQALAVELLDNDSFGICLPAAEDEADDSNITSGVVVPFRAQRRDITEHVPNAVAVDTVERFQGGERDLMIMSMSASDRGYISQLSEFLLESNRFNVGASRMKRKLVIIASSAIFEESSNEIDAFEDQKAWISFFQAMGGLSESPEPIPVTELVSDDVASEFLGPRERATTVRVYSGYDP